MSGKNRNQQQPQQRQAQPPAVPPEDKQENQEQGQEDQANQDSASQDTGNEQQQSNDQATGDQAAAEQKTPVQEPVQEKAVEVAAPVPKTQQEGFTPVYKVQLDLANYAEAMDNKKSIVPEEGGKWQYSLYSTLKDVLNAKDQDTFNKEWNTALVFFNQNKDGVFNENFIFRFPEQWPGSSNEFTSFRRIVFMMLQTSNVKTRKAELKHINMELVVEGLNQAQRTKLLNFYEA